jgi:hypothetical protein
MKNENDKIIQKLKKVLEQKKLEISKVERPTYLTNCAFRYSENTSAILNLNTVNDVIKLVTTLALLLEKESHYTRAVELLGVEVEPFKWFGFTVEEWATDFKTRIGKIGLAETKREYAEIEKILANKISKELKDKIELEAIAKKLGI